MLYLSHRGGKVQWQSKTDFLTTTKTHRQANETEEGKSDRGESAALNKVICKLATILRKVDLKNKVFGIVASV